MQARGGLQVLGFIICLYPQAAVENRSLSEHGEALSAFRNQLLAGGKKFKTHHRDAETQRKSNKGKQIRFPLWLCGRSFFLFFSPS